MILNDKEAYVQVANELGLTVAQAYKAYRAYWTFIKKTIQELPLNECQSEEEFNQKYKCSFNVPRLGKLFVSWDQIQRIRRRIEWLKEHKLEQNNGKKE